MKFWDFVYKYFGKSGNWVIRIYPNLPENIRRSGMHIYPEVYASFIVFTTFISVVITIVLIRVAFMFGVLLSLPFIVLIPFLTFIILVNIPSLIGSSRAGGIEGELPYTAAYLSIMITSGLSPYVAFERISKAKKVFPKFSDISQKFILFVRVLGKDPLTAFSILAERTPSPSTRDLLTGYITTVRAGGDVGDYLTKKARLLFSEILVKMKIIADKLSGLLESYLALILLSTISLSVMYLVTLSLGATVTFGLSAEGMYIFLYILAPFLSAMTMYLTDLIQYKEPWIDYRPYIVFFGLTLPLAIFFIFFGLFLPSILPSTHPFINTFFVQGITWMLSFPAKYMNLETYLYPSVEIAMSLIIATIPSVLYAEYLSSEYKIVQGITRFLRDLVEVRKTGLSPERSIIELSRRNYGRFTKYLKKMAMQLSMGIPLSKIINELFRKIIVWRAKVLLYMMTDSIEVGGGTIEVMENLAWFAESVEAIDEERKKNLRVLLVVPYMGAILAAATVIMLTVFLGSLPLSTGPYKYAASVTLPSIVINTYMMGLVAGKVSAGSVASGFKHALFLTLVTLVFIMLTSFMQVLLGGIITKPV